MQGYDYATPGSYFVTICTRNRACVLGDVSNGETRLSKAGQVAKSVWEGLPLHYPHVQLDTWVIMPNHVHGILVLLPEEHVNIYGGLVVGAGFKPAPTNANADNGSSVRRHGLPEIVRAFKTFSARRINDLVGEPGVPFWQRNYYEHVIRDEASLNRIRQYILENPARWDDDPENPDMVPGRGRFETCPYGFELGAGGSESGTGGFRAGRGGFDSGTDGSESGTGGFRAGRGGFQTHPYEDPT